MQTTQSTQDNAVRFAARSPKEGGRLGPIRSEASPMTSQLIGNSFRVQGAETAPLLGLTRYARIISRIRSLVCGHEGRWDSLVATCASDILHVRGLEQWIESIATLTHRERTEKLLRASGKLKAADISSTLSCMAKGAGLFLAIQESKLRTVQFAQVA